MLKRDNAYAENTHKTGCLCMKCEYAFCTLKIFFHDAKVQIKRCVFCECIFVTLAGDAYAWYILIVPKGTRNLENLNAFV